MSRTVTQRTKPRRREFFRNDRGELQSEKRYDEEREIDWDIANDLNSGEAISSVSWSLSGLSEEVTGTYTGTRLTCTVGQSGTAECKVTTDASRVLEYRWRFVATDYARDDYR
jgi:hypothetical protein